MVLPKKNYSGDGSSPFIYLTERFWFYDEPLVIAYVSGMNSSNICMN